MDAPARLAPASATANRENLLLLTQLRWIAAAGQVATILFVRFALGIHLPLAEMGGVIVVLLVLNGATLWRYRYRPPVTNAELFVQLLLDVAVLTAQLHFSGGATNPFVMLFLLQIILSAVLLEAWSAWALVAVTCICFVALMSDTTPLATPPGFATHMVQLQLEGMFICFLLAAGLLVFSIDRINRNLRHRDQRLAELRRQAIEEEHVVRMGLLASGAAHELGTPLATLSVILSDWRRMPAFAGSSELAQEMDDMQLQLDRCKAIVTGILLSFGEARGEGVQRTTVAGFLDELVADWRARRTAPRIDYRNEFAPDVTILSDPGLKQVVASLFENAFEASPGWVGLIARRAEDALVLVIEDRGPGFRPEMLGEIGKPYRSSKDRAGSGLGLFLVVNVVRKLGGDVTACNRPGGGASVTLTLPLERLAVEASDGR